MLLPVPRINHFEKLNYMIYQRFSSIQMIPNKICVKLILTLEIHAFNNKLQGTRGISKSIEDGETLHGWPHQK